MSRHTLRLSTVAQKLSYIFQSIRKISNLPTGEGCRSVTGGFSRASLDPFTYTTGRWLHYDEEQRKARFLQFDFSMLCQQAINACHGASRVLRYEKREGGFNRVFILHMDNGRRVVAKLPFGLAGPRCLMTESEVATMAYGEP